jgi:HlyD family secretion protein
MQTYVQWRRRIVLGAIVFLVAAGVAYGFRPQPIEVDTAPVRRGPLQVAVEQEGRTRVIDRYVITAPVSGYARRITLDVGNAVQRGATLVELEPVRADALDARHRAEASARIGAATVTAQAAGQRAIAAASAAQLTQIELLRIQALRQSGHATAADHDRAASAAYQAAAELRSALFSVATARHEIDAAQTALKYTGSAGNVEPLPVRAPVAGSILRIPRKSEGPVSAGQALIEIGDPGALEVEVDLLSADAVRVHPGTAVLFERWGGGDALKGVVRVVEPAGFTKVSALGVEEQRVWVIVAFTSPPPDWQRLGDAYRVEARLIVWEAKDVLQMPASALFRDGDGWAVFVAEAGVARKRRVKTGQSNGLQAELVSGIEAGTKVIVHPDDRLRDGVAVAAR